MLPAIVQLNEIHLSPIVLVLAIALSISFGFIMLLVFLLLRSGTRKADLMSNALSASPQSQPKPSRLDDQTLSNTEQHPEPEADSQTFSNADQQSQDKSSKLAYPDQLQRETEESVEIVSLQPPETPPSNNR
jgi:hypothetical protein